MSTKKNFVDKKRFYEQLEKRYETVLKVKEKQQKYYQMVDRATGSDERKSSIRSRIKMKLHQIPIDDYIGECILKICKNLIRKRGFIEYSQTHSEDMIGDAIENCFHRSTKVMTIEHGSIEIEKIVGKEVTVKAKDGVWRKAKVRSYGEQDLYEYTFGCNKETVSDQYEQKVIATKDHRWFLSSRVDENGNIFEYENEVTDLRVGDSLALVSDPKVGTPEEYEHIVTDINYFGKDEVFCLEEPVTHSFVLGNGLLTGNCILYISSFDPRKSKEPFSYFTQVANWAFIRRIEKEKREVYFKLRSLHNMDGLMDNSHQEDHDHSHDGKLMSDDYLIHTRNYVNEYEEKMEKKRKKQRKKKQIKNYSEYFPTSNEENVI